MVIELCELDVTVEEQTIEEEGQPMRIIGNVERVGCSVTARVEKRRANGPALIVGTGEGVGRTRVQEADGGFAGQASFDVSRDAVGHSGLRVSRQDVLDAFEDGAVDALRAVVKAVDRELGPEPASK